MNNAQRWQWLLIVAVIGGLVWLLSPILMPFMLAAVFAYLGDPLADRLERLRLNRTLAASVVFLVMLLGVALVLVLLVPLIQRQIARLIAALPAYAAWVTHSAIPWLEQKLHVPASEFDTSTMIARTREHLGTLGGIAATVLGYATRSGLALIGWVVSVVLVPVVTFYLLRDWDKLVAHIDALLPRDAQPTIRRLARETDSVLGAFVRGQLLVMLGLAIYYAIALKLVGLDVGPLIGMIAGLVSFVPYLGFIIGIVASIIAALVQYHDVYHLILVLVVFGIGNLLESYVLVPKLVGDRIGLHPVAVIFAVLAFGDLFGFIGVLLALPMAAIAVVLLRFLRERYEASPLYAGREPQKIVSAADAPPKDGDDTPSEPRGTPPAP
ncbi:MAG: Putative permease often clustered with de novo purine synthesis [Rhodanobacteraceae bacterium]|jgi:predicted PurR-regulated permease PerM|nr:MAG: Putative permease often clustered with de novo purine synthesis [Rhodanobacteraceae bacterium]